MGVAEAVPDTAVTVVDLYSGVGLFAGTVARPGRAVTAVEGNPAAVKDGLDAQTMQGLINTAYKLPNYRVISMLKNTSIISVIGYAELLYSAQIIYARTYETIPLLIVASLWCLVLTSVMYVGQYYIERHFAKGALLNLPPTPFQRLKMRFGGQPA